jgi:hypothetical protein
VITDVSSVSISGAGTGSVSSVSVVSNTLQVSGSPITSVGQIDIEMQSTGVVAGLYGSSTEVPVITIDDKGRIVEATNISIGTGTGTVTSVGIISMNDTIAIQFSPITSAGDIDIGLPTTGVTAGSYTSADITVDEYGRITSAANGSSIPSGGLTSQVLTYNNSNQLVWVYSDGGTW